MPYTPRLFVTDHEDYALCERELRDNWLARHPGKYPRIYAICDSDEYKDCEEWLRTQWEEEHPGQDTRRGGRPSLKDEVEKLCEGFWPKPPQKITSIHTLAWLVRRVADKLKWVKPTKSNRDQTQTIRKFAKAWLLRTQPQDRLPSSWTKRTGRTSEREARRVALNIRQRVERLLAEPMLPLTRPSRNS